MHLGDSAAIRFNDHYVHTRGDEYLRRVVRITEVAQRASMGPAERRWRSALLS